MTEEPMPPLGVRLTVDVQAREGARGTTYYARVRWTHPVTHHREGVKRTHGSLQEARAWVERLEGAARTGVDAGQPLADYVAQLGDRWARGIDPTSTLDPYSAGLRKRVLPALGHLPVSMMSAGLIDRAIDQWEAAYGRSTVKNTIAALVRWCWMRRCAMGCSCATPQKIGLGGVSSVGLPRRWRLRRVHAISPCRTSTH